MANCRSPEFILIFIEVSLYCKGSSIWMDYFKGICIHASFYFSLSFLSTLYLFSLSCISISPTMNFLFIPFQWILCLMEYTHNKSFDLNFNNLLGHVLACHAVNISHWSCRFGFLCHRSYWGILLYYSWAILSPSGPIPACLDHFYTLSNLKLRLVWYRENKLY